MGARCVIQITEPSGRGIATYARVYLHWGGEHFDDVRDTLLAFIEANASSPDPRWTDAPYLSARFMAWEIDRHRDPGAHPLHFLSVGLVDDPGWGDYHGTLHTERGALIVSAGPSPVRSDQRIVGTFIDGALVEFTDADGVPR